MMFGIWGWGMFGYSVHVFIKRESFINCSSQMFILLHSFKCLTINNDREDYLFKKYIYIVISLVLLTFISKKDDLQQLIKSGSKRP